MGSKKAKNCRILRQKSYIFDYFCCIFCCKTCIFFLHNTFNLYFLQYSLYITVAVIAASKKLKAKITYSK